MPQPLPTTQQILEHLDAVLVAVNERMRFICSQAEWRSNREAIVALLDSAVALREAIESKVEGGVFWRLEDFEARRAQCGPSIAGLAPPGPNQASVLQHHFQQVLNGSVNVELRKVSRSLRVGDLIHLREWVPARTYSLEHICGGIRAGGQVEVAAHHTGRELTARLLHIGDAVVSAEEQSVAVIIEVIAEPPPKCSNCDAMLKTGEDGECSVCSARRETRARAEDPVR